MEQLASALNPDVKTVRRWIDRPYAPRQTAQRDSKLDPFKGRIVRWLESHPLTAQQVLQASLGRNNCVAVTRAIDRIGGG